jgi:hypothetical protein
MTREEKKIGLAFSSIMWIVGVMLGAGVAMMIYGYVHGG